MLDKSSLRLELRKVLSQLPDTTKAAASASLRSQLEASLVFMQGITIAVFYPTASEPRILPLIALPGKSFLFPLCHADRSLTWHRPDNIHLWQPGPFGIIEPIPALAPAIHAPPFDLVLVPGLAFTRRGARLGHGAGFYDRFLASISPNLSTISLCFDCQIVPFLPTEAHDIRVQQVLHA